MLVAVVVASLAVLSTSLLPGMAEWPGTHWMKIENDMELRELWIEEVRGFDKMRASHNDLISVQKYGDWRMVGVGGCPCWFHGSCFLFVGAAECSSFGFDGGNHFTLDWRFSSENPVFCPSTSGSMKVDGVISLAWSSDGETASAF